MADPTYPLTTHIFPDCTIGDNDITIPYSAIGSITKDDASDVRKLLFAILGAGATWYSTTDSKPTQMSAAKSLAIKGITGKYTIAFSFSGTFPTFVMADEPTPNP